MTKSRHPFGLFLLFTSLALHLATLLLFSKQPDLLAAFTILPIWFWGTLGLTLSLSAHLLFRTPLALTMSLVWFLSILLLSDESTPIGRIGLTPPEPGIPAPHAGRTPIRILTINWSNQESTLVESIKPWQPDIVFIQGVPRLDLVAQLSQSLHGRNGDYRFSKDYTCAIVLRGEISMALLNPRYRSQFVTARLPSGAEVELVNLHLQPASTNLSLWDPKCWRAHRTNRENRRLELQFAVAFLEEYTPFPRRPAIIAGDFNAPANDAALRVLRPDFTDNFQAVGTGWGNTYHRRIPLLRLDQIHTSQAFLPIRSRTVAIPESDHLMLISDLLLE
ncbi:MAG: endonuclease/exonuclease/phosphatase family protein [Verrucomicrobiota bacterium]